MTLQQIKTAIKEGKQVHWKSGYNVIKDSKSQYLIVCTSNNSAIGLTWADNVTLNGKEQDFNTSSFYIGQLVKYATPINKEEEDARFTVLEISPANDGLKEKLTVQYVCDMYIKPVSTYFSSEFTKA